ncbi:MAG: hypothetical protein P0120_03810 [Nitrospira sp.]|nr:hypothetical protein [Nitrospira sp.]
MDPTGSLRQAVSILLLWTISLLLAVAMADAETLSFLDGQIRLYPAQQEGDRILIPFAHPPAPNEEVLLLYHRTDLYHLTRIQEETIMPKSMAHPRPHYVYGLTEGRLSDPQAQFLVAVGKGITSRFKWKASDAMSSYQTASSCMTPDKGFVITGLQVLISEEWNAKVYYLQEEIRKSTSDMMIDEDDHSGISMKEMVGMVESENSCHVLAYNTSDAYGLQNSGSLEPVGPIFGIMELSTGRSTERWLVLRSAMREVWGYTFIELPLRPLNREPKRRFLLEDRG